MVHDYDTTKRAVKKEVTTYDGYVGWQNALKTGYIVCIEYEYKSKNSGSDWGL